MTPSQGAWHHDTSLRVLVTLTAAAAVAGVVSGMLLEPGSAGLVVAAGVVQLACTAAIAGLARRPLAVAVLVLGVCLVTAFADPALTELAARGASGWAPLAIGTAAQLLFRTAADPVSVRVGVLALVLASAAPVAVNLQAGLPPAAAVLAGAVPLLVGALIAVGSRLGNARRDRLRDELAPLPAPAGGAAERQVHPHLPMAILRLEQLAASTPDAESRTAATDVAHLLRTAATGPDDTATIRVEIVPARPAAVGASPAPDVATASERPHPDLSDREEAILRLVSTGASNRTIARDLYLSEATVKQYVSRLMRRLGCENRTQLALLAHPWFPTG